MRDAVQHNSRSDGEPPRSSGRVRTWSLRFSERRALLLAGDLAVLSASLGLSLWLGRSVIAIRGVYGYLRAVPQPKLLWWLTLAALWIVLSMVLDCYDLHVAAQSVRSAVNAGGTALLVSALYLVTPVISAPLTASRLGWFIFALTSSVGVGLWRALYASTVRQPAFSRNLVIVGAGRSGTDLVQRLDALGDGTGIAIRGFIDDDPTTADALVAGYPVLGGCEDLVRCIEELQVNEIVIAITNPADLSARLRDELGKCWIRGTKIVPLLAFFEEAFGELPAEHMGPNVFSVMHVQDSTLQRLWDFVRRMIDIGMAASGLALVGAMCPFIAAAIRLDSPGPILYRQQRVGKRGHVFTLCKFRSMVQNAEQRGAVWATEGDPRITPVGSLLRRMRVDELPQLWNVLLGSMTLVGPRPERPEFVHDLCEAIPYYNLRHSVKPGLTGWAQVRHPYGNSVEDARAKLRYDLYYIKHRGPLLDLNILLKTVRTVARMEGV